MTAPNTPTDVLLQPPTPEMFNDAKDFYKFLYELWQRSGGYNSNALGISGLKVSVNELNTLIGIDTHDTVQEQLNEKLEADDIGSMALQDSNNVAITGGSISNTDITVSVGDSATDIYLGGTLNVNNTIVGNIGAGEDTLISYSMDANSLAANGDHIEISAWGVVAANANNKTIKLKLGTTTVLTTGAVAANAGSWSIEAKVIRTGASTQQVIAKIISDNALIVDSATYTAATESMIATLVISCTGEGTSDDDIVQRGLLIKWFKA